jgi:hypothetical protein
LVRQQHLEGEGEVQESEGVEREEEWSEDAKRQEEEDDEEEDQKNIRI